MKGGEIQVDFFFFLQDFPLRSQILKYLWSTVKTVLNITIEVFADRGWSGYFLKSLINLKTWVNLISGE